MLSDLTKFLLASLLVPSFRGFEFLGYRPLAGNTVPVYRVFDETNITLAAMKKLTLSNLVSEMLESSASLLSMLFLSYPLALP